jgi:hypothetical protein
MIRKVVKWFLILIGVFVGLNILLIIALQSSRFQTFITQKATKYLKQEFEIDAEIERIDISFFNKVSIKNILVKDHKSDTLLFSSKLTTNILQPASIGDKLKLRNIEFEGTTFNLFTHPGDTFTGLDWFIDKVSGPPSETPRQQSYLVDIKNVNFKNSICNIQQDGFNATFRIGDLNTEYIFWENDSLAIEILPSCLSIDSFTNLTNLEGFYGMIGTEKIILDRFQTSAEESSLIADGTIDFTSGKMDWFAPSTKYQINIHELVYNKSEVNYPIVNNNLPKQTISLVGELSGNSKKMYLKDIDFVVHDSKGFLNGKIKNIFNPQRIHLDLDIDHLSVHKPVVNQYIEDLSEEAKKTVNNLLPLTYKGKYKGNFQLNESIGLFKTAIGNVNTDVQILFEKNYTNAFYFAKVDIDDFQVDKLLNSPDFGQSKVQLDINGEGLNFKDLKIGLKSKVHSFPFSGYQYKNVDINGRVSHNKYQGDLTLVDSNLDLKFNGLVDLTPNNEILNFEAKIKNAQLKNLNLTESKNQINADIIANFEGVDIDDSEGIVKVFNTKYTNQQGSYSSDSIIITNSIDSLGTRRLDFKSEIVNAFAVGHFKLATISKNFVNSITPFVDSNYSKNLEVDSIAHLEDYRINVRVKKSDCIDSLLGIPLEIAPLSTIDINKRKNRTPSIQINSPNIKHADKNINNVFAISYVENNKLNLSLDATDIQIKNQDLRLRNILSQFSLNQNRLISDIRWDAAFDSTNYGGNIIINSAIDTLLNIRSDIHPISYIYMADSVWGFTENNSIDFIESELYVENLGLKTESQELMINGNLDFDTLNTLDIEVDNFDFGNIHPYIQKYKTKLDGNVFGNIHIDDLIDSPEITTSIIVDSLVLNDLWLGDLIIQNDKKENSKTIDYLIELEKNSFKTIEGSASYNPSIGFSSLSMLGKINKLRLDFIRPYVDEYIENLAGRIDGSIAIRDGEVNGSIELEKVNFDLGLIGTKYNLQGKPVINISESTIQIPNLAVNVSRLKNDKENKFGQAIINGNIFHHEFGDFRYDIKAKFDDFLAMSTQNDGSSPFFGEAIASGTLTMTGEGASPKIKIDAQSEKGTDISIYSSDDNEISENSFIYFVEDNKEKENQSEKDIEEESSNTNYEIDLNIRVLPSSNISFNLDGSHLNGRGYGDLRVKVYSTLDFDLYGKFEVDEAKFSYAFSENIINKEFDIDKGGTVVWNGDPFKGLMDIKAKYLTNLDVSAFDPNEEERKNVQANILLKGELLKPDVKFDIDIPTGSDLTKSKIRELTNTEDKLAKQFISILLLNSFYIQNEGININNGLNNTLISSGFGLLTNNFNRWLNENQDQFDIELKFNPGTGSNLSQTEIQLILKKSFLNNRLHLNGNLGTPLGENTSSIKGDIDLKYDLHKDGKLQLKAYNKSFENQLSNKLDFKQGFGISYRYEFDHLFRNWKSNQKKSSSTN